MSIPEGLVVVAVSSGIILSNVINVVVLSQVRRLPRTMRVFLINLSASDLLIGIVACAPASYSAFTGRWPYGAIWCQISGITHGTSAAISIWSIAMVGVDRYIAACHPHKYQHSYVRNHCQYIVVALWFVAFATFLAPIFTEQDWSYYKYDTALKMCGLYWKYPVFCVATGVYIPVLSGSVLLFTTLRTNQVLKKRITNEVNNGLRVNVNAKLANNSTTKQNAMKILVLASVCYFTCWGPYTVIVVMKSFIGNSFTVTPWLVFGSLWLANTNSVLNVFIYSGTNSAFRETAAAVGLRISAKFCGRPRKEASPVQLTDRRSSVIKVTPLQAAE